MDNSAAQGGLDSLQANPSYDIPRISEGIPIVSKLSKQEKLDQLHGVQVVEKIKQDRRDKVNNVMDQQDDNLETHFVENPYIKIRERASLR